MPAEDLPTHHHTQPREREPVRSTKLGRIIVGVAGATGTGGLGLATVHMISGHGVSADMWASLLVTTGLIAALGLILQYLLGRLAIHARAASARREAQLRQARLILQQSVLAKTAGGAEGAQAYRIMATADALYFSVEQNGSLLDDQRHERLYGTQASCIQCPHTRRCELPPF